MDLGGPAESRLVGDYILGPRIGSGSFAVVWRSRHRKSGHEVAVKEIAKKQLNPKIRDSLIKEISILSTINHPNIIRLLEATESEDKIYLVLEYCDGGDLAAYIHRHGKVSEGVARHFMRQLAAGLQVLQEKHLIHRDLKPQNLLLSANESTPLLKIGDFGFARSLTPQGLADTLCGSPLYMAPEIIQNEKYDAKVDLWSVGAILFQLVTGRPPFDGNSQFQLFQNILTSTELKFPAGALEELHPDCVDLCRCLLRQNPVERLSFKEFFCHNFLQEPRPMLSVKQSSLPPTNSYAFNKESVFPSAPVSAIFTEPENIVFQEQCEGTSSTQNVHGHIATIASGCPRESIKHKPSPSNRVQVSDSMEAIERDYVLVNAHLSSVECISYFRETSLQLECKTGAITDTTKLSEQANPIVQAKDLASSSVDCGESSQNCGAGSFPTSTTSTMLREVQGLSILHPSTRLQLLHQYVEVLAELSQEKCDAELYLESFSVELVILAVWKKALQICSTWSASIAENEESASSSANEPKLLCEGGTVDFSSPSSVSSWAEKSFLLAFNRAEKLEHHIRNMDGTADMPDAMEIVFQKALAFGTTGAVDEFVNKSTAADSYSKALILLSFISGEATMLSLSPPFVLTPDNKKRIQQYIANLHSRQTNFLKSQPSLKQLLDSPTK